MKKKLGTRLLSAVLIAAMTAGLAACGSSTSSTSSASAGTGTAAQTAGTDGTQSTETASAAATEPAAAEGDGILNIGFTDTLGTLNPLNMDWTFINLYATSMMFLPMVSFNDQYTVDYLLADSITTEDNQTFTVKLKDNAAWSDGEPVTADDVIWTILKFTCPEVANASFDFSPFKGFGDDGTSPEGATSIEGLKKVDDKTLQFICKEHMSLNTFLNNVATWICILPEHVLKDTPDDQLLTSDWFNKPTVVSGPYFVDTYDAAHYISYTANDNYFAGAPKIKKVNFRIESGSELLAGLQSGELDMIHPSCSIPVSDRSKVEGLSDYTAQYTDNIINEMTFINTSKITDPKVRQAIVYAIDRNTIVTQLLSGKGEVSDGVICSASPFYKAEDTVFTYDPEKAKELLSEAGWDGSTTIQYYVASSDDTVVKASQLVQQYLAAVGIKVNINTVDFATLMSLGGTDDVDMFSVQYTIVPNDYWADLNSLVNTEGTSWTGGYVNKDIDAALAKTQETTDENELKELYDSINEKINEDVPLFSLYFQSNLGVVSKKLKNATPSFYGAFDNIQDWEFAE
ncbi:MAG: peptide ABC transporter substrate-binding protein [Lachnospiraceae bacterium]|nr:peptide ABC transporter substrate-binding protein [Lachnospiraceae bacterium]